MAKKDELPQAMVDRMAREENEADRELIAKPLRALKNKVKEDLTGGASTSPRLNMGKLPGKAAAQKLDMQDSSDTEKRNAAAYLRKGYSDKDAKDMAKQKAFKSGGKVASHKKTLEKAGFYDKGKTKSDREKIVKRSTTKPERIEMFEKIFSTKRMSAGGMASKRADGCAVRGKTKA